MCALLLLLLIAWNFIFSASSFFFRFRCLLLFTTPTHTKSQVYDYNFSINVASFIFKRNKKKKNLRALGTSRLLHRSQWHFSLLYVTSIIVSCFPPSLSSLYKTDKNAAYLLNYHLLHERCVDVLFFSGFYYLQEFYCFLFSLRSGSLTHFLRSWFYFCCFFLYITLLDRLLFPLYVPLYLNLINEFDFAVK